MPHKLPNRRQSVFPSDILGGLKISVAGGATLGGKSGAGGKILIAVYENSGDQIASYPVGSPTTQHLLNLDTATLPHAEITATSPLTFTADVDSLLRVEVFLEYEFETGIVGGILTPKTGTNSSKRDVSFPAISAVHLGAGLYATYWMGDVFCAENDVLQIGLTAYNNTASPKNLTVKSCEMYLYR